MNDWLTNAFALVCGQHPEHIWAPGGLALPCCQRCTGLYVGAALAFVLHLICGAQSSTRSKWLHGMFLLQMVPFGFHWLPQGPLLRTATGVLFGFGVVAYLWLIPDARWPLAAGIGSWLPHRRLAFADWLLFGASWRRLLQELNCSSGYGLGLTVSLLLVPVLALWGGRFGSIALSLCAVLGAVVLAGLALMNIGLAITALTGWAYSTIGKDQMGRTARPRSADFQSAVSPIFNRHGVPGTRKPSATTDVLQVENLRYSRLEICATCPPPHE